MSSSIWSVLQGMRGRYISTLVHGKKFQIAMITPYELIIRPVKQRKPRTLTRECVQDAWRNLIFHRRLSINEIAEKYSKFNSAYLAAILATMPDVTYTTNPIVLILSRNNEQPNSSTEPNSETEQP